MKIIFPCLILTLTFFSFSCPSGPQVTEDDQTESQEGTFVVSKERYEQTFDDIEGLIQTLNAVIARRNFNQWKTYLSENYINELSSQETLTALNERPVLKTSGIELKSLEDYFRFVVVPSRQNVKLDEIEFLDNNHLTAYMYNRGDPEQRIILYQLSNSDGQWKITLW